MILRIYARVVLIKCFGLDDLLMMLAVICNTVVTILSIRVIDFGAGKHIAAIPPEDLVLLFKNLVAAQLVYMITLWLCRISGLAFYARIAKDVIQLQVILAISWVVVSLTLVTQLLLISLQCIPLDKLWNPMLKGTCLGNSDVFLPTAATTIICDTIVLLIPIAIIIRLNASVKRKLLLGVVMCFGFFAVLASIFRVMAMIPATRPTTTDPTQYFAYIMVWSGTEIATAIIALCMPSLKPLFGRLLSDSPTSSSPNSSKKSADSDDSAHMMKPIHRQNHRQRTPTSTTTDTETGGGNGSEENLWVDGNIVSADSHGKVTPIEMDAESVGRQ